MAPCTMRIIAKPQSTYASTSPCHHHHSTHQADRLPASTQKVQTAGNRSLPSASTHQAICRPRLFPWVLSPVPLPPAYGTPINIPHHQHSSIASLDAKGPDGWQSMHQHSSKVSMNAQTSTHQLHACQYLPRVLSPVFCRMHAAINIPQHQHSTHRAVCRPISPEGIIPSRLPPAYSHHHAPSSTSTHQLHACQYLPRVLSPVVCRMHAATNIMCPLIINTHRLPLHQHHHTHHQHSTVIGPHHAAEAKLIRPRRGISMGRFFGYRTRSRGKRIPIFRFQNPPT